MTFMGGQAVGHNNKSRQVPSAQGKAEPGRGQRHLMSKQLQWQSIFKHSY